MYKNKDYSRILKNSKKKLIVGFLVLSVVFLAFVGTSLYQLKKQRFDAYTKNIDITLHNASSFYTQLLVRKYRLTISRLIANENVIQHFINEDRNTLLTSIKEEWNFIKSDNPYVQAMQFHTKDGKSFLRMHKPLKHSDFIAKDRKMLQAIHKNHVEYYGYETGRYTTTFRIISPIFEHEEYIGALEIGINPNYIIDHIEETIGEEGFFFIAKDKLNLMPQNYDISIGNLVATNLLNKEKLKIIKAVPNDYMFDTQITQTVGDRTYLFTPVPVHDFENNVPMQLLFAEDISEFVKAENQRVIISILIIFFVTVFFFVLIQRYINDFEYILSSFFQKIIKSEEGQKNYLQAVEDSSHNFIIVTNGMNLSIMNKTAYSFLGFSSTQEFLKKYHCIGALFVEREGYIKSNMNGLYWCAYVEENPELTHKALIENEGKLYTFLVTSKKIINSEKLEYVVTLTNITEIEQLQKEYEYIIKRNEFAEKGANFALWDWNLKDDSVYYSEIWKALLGYKDDEIPHLLESWKERIHYEDKKNVIKDLDAHFKKETPYFVNQHRLRKKDGTYLMASFRGQAIFDKHDIPIRMVGIYTNITREVENTTKIKKQEDMMIAQSKQAAMGEMLSMIAHQWRQPIASIAMEVNNILLDLELDSIDPKELEDECNGILEQTKYLSHTIDDFRNFFKEDKEKTEINIESVIIETIELMCKSFENNNIEIITNFFHTEAILTMPREIVQILLNLFKNAKEVLIENKIAKKEIRIYTSEDEKYVYVDVEDNAGGVPEKLLQRIFQPYFTTKDEHNGTGLGLYMSKILAQKHLGGNLSVKNSQRGAIFTISIRK